MDAVSGATYSSAGLIEAVRNALQGAATGGGTAVSAPVTTAPAKTTAPAEIPQGKFPYPDGVYKGSGEGYRGETHLQLTLKNGTITKIEVLDTEDDAAFFKRAEALIATVIGQQSTEVDAVSGATFSSEGILEAIDDALNAAQKGGRTGGDNHCNHRNHCLHRHQRHGKFHRDDHRTGTADLRGRRVCGNGGL